MTEEMKKDEVGSETASAPSSKRPESAGISRRGLLIGIGSTVALMGLGATRYLGHTPINRPPGGQDESGLVSACIRCERCYEACPRHVIVPADIEDGLLGMRSPTLDFSKNYCDFCVEENGGYPRCVEMCPTEALKLPDGWEVGNPETASRGNVIIGLATIDEYSCLAFRDTGCRDCYDACTYEAIRLEGSERCPRPYVEEDKCNGCGACESVCMSMSAGSITQGATRRAIIVEPIQA